MTNQDFIKIGCQGDDEATCYRKRYIFEVFAELSSK